MTPPSTPRLYVERENPPCRLGDRIELADTPWRRLKGLLGRRGLATGEGMLITECRCIHTFFMDFSIDAVFFDKTGRVVGLCKRMPPFRMSPYFFKAWGVLELSEGSIERFQLKKGQRLIWRKV